MREGWEGGREGWEGGGRGREGWEGGTGGREGGTEGGKKVSERGTEQVREQGSKGRGREGVGGGRCDDNYKKNGRAKITYTFALPHALSDLLQRVLIRLILLTHIHVNS